MLLHFYKGMHKGSGKLSGDAMYDARLFNQSSGIDSGFGGEDEYNTYSKPLFDRIINIAF